MVPRAHQDTPMTFPNPLDRSKILSRGTACAECHRRHIVSELCFLIITSVLIACTLWLLCRNVTALNRSARSVLNIIVNAYTAPVTMKRGYRRGSANRRPSYIAANGPHGPQGRRRRPGNKLTPHQRLSSPPILLLSRHIPPVRIIHHRLRAAALNLCLGIHQYSAIWSIYRMTCCRGIEIQKCPLPFVPRCEWTRLACCFLVTHVISKQPLYV
jgi:hypothetical protein